MFDMINDQLATNLRRLRIARHLSLSELARATGIGKATLSSIENGRANPTVSTLTALADALRVPVTDLLAEPELGEVRVVRASGVDGVERPVTGAPFEVRELSLPPRQSLESEPRAPGTREELFVLEGKLVAGPAERITELARGDYASFPADVARVYETGRQGARALAVVQ